VACIVNVSYIDLQTIMRQCRRMARDFMTAFGAAVRRLRELRAMTQAELAERVGLGRTSMTNLERGRQNPPLSLLPELARALGVTVTELIAEATRTPNGADHEVLATAVQDDQLRKWASQVIADRPRTSPTGHSR
jgi:transcriptional regulator with XRE-family HTH domain